MTNKTLEEKAKEYVDERLSKGKFLNRRSAYYGFIAGYKQCKKDTQEEKEIEDDQIKIKVLRFFIGALILITPIIFMYSSIPYIIGYVVNDLDITNWHWMLRLIDLLLTLFLGGGLGLSLLDDYKNYLKEKK